MNKPVNLTGQVFGRLTVLYQSDKSDNSGKVYWHCECECKNHIDVLAMHLKNGATKSCGCLQKESAARMGRRNIQFAIEKNTLVTGEASCRELYSSYKYNAKRRELSFELTLDDFKFLTKQECYWCGEIPLFVHHRPRNNEDYIYNGIDRLDNNIGYTVENCVPCCGVCNYAKRTKTAEEFIEWINKVYYHIHRNDSK